MNPLASPPSQPTVPCRGLVLGLAAAALTACAPMDSGSVDDGAEQSIGDGTRMTALSGTPATFIHAPNGDFSLAHTDPFMTYTSWGGSSWCAELYGNTFRHAPWGGSGCNWSQAHTDSIINYLTWNGDEWTATVSNNVFRHVKRATGAAHEDVVLDYRHPGGSTWRMKVGACGDGYVMPGEECDGSADCTSTCQLAFGAAGVGNTVYGHWSSSGGQSPGSAGNRAFLVQYLGQTGPVTFRLSSSVDGFLYLLDANGNVLASDDNSGGGTHALITAELSEGRYQLVAATQAPGLSGEFTLASDKAMIRYPQRLEVLQASRFTWAYDDRGTGSHNDVSVWRPDLSQYPGYFSLGDVAMPNHGTPPGSTFVVRGDGDLLAPPVGYNWVWSDWGSGGDHDVSIWDPIAPEGYTCLGTVVALGYDAPSTQLIRCIKSAYVLPANTAWVWSDSGSGADHDVSFWQVDARDFRGLRLSTFGAIQYYGSPTRTYWTLNKSATANSELSGAPVDASVAWRYAPRVWLAAGEYYLPSSTSFFLPNVHEEVHDGESYLVTNEPLGCDSCTDPQFLDGQNPAQTAVPVYAEIVPRTQGGVPSNVTDVLYWMFYPYNNGKRVCIGWMSPLGCVGGYSTFGNHVGDWEHMTLRFIDGRPAQVYMSQHSGGQLFDYGDKAVIMDDWRPEVFAALGSHGVYPDARRHTYESLPNGDTLNDDTSYGTAWNTWDALEVFQVQPPGSYTGSLSWLNFTGRWGNPESGCGLAEEVSGECVLNPGPASLMTRSVSNPEWWNLD